MPSRACYQAGCDRPECRAASARYSKQLTLEHHRGQWRLCDAAPTRDHIHRLLDAGWTFVQIARTSGVLAETLRRLHVGDQDRVGSRRADAVLAIKVSPPPLPPAFTDAIGSQRRLRALCVLGHTLTSLAPHLDMTLDRLSAITSGLVTKVRTREAKAITHLYRTLCTVPGPSTQIRTTSLTKGWHGPLAWDDIDDPQTQPETDGRRTGGYHRHEPVDVAEVARLTRAGKTAREIARQLRCDKRTVVRARRRTEMAVAA